jgi:chromosomal replication initiation ATPase DnaA
VSYQQDLAKLHKERMARLWPVNNADNTVQKLSEKVTRLKTEIALLEARRDRLETTVKELDRLQTEARGEERLITLRERICQEHDMPVEVFCGPGHSQLIVIARRQFAQEARAMGVSHQRIGYHIGGRDHSTVINYIKPKKQRSNSWKPAGKRYLRQSPDAEPMVG